MTDLLLITVWLWFLCSAIQMCNWKCLIRVFRQIYTDGFVNSSIFFLLVLFSVVCFVPGKDLCRQDKEKKKKTNKKIQRSAEDKGEKWSKLARN